MRRFGSSSRSPSSEFERISLEDLSSPDRQPPPQVQIVPPEDEPQQTSPLPRSPTRPIQIPRVELRRQNTTGLQLHWRKPSYSRVDSSVNPRTDNTEPSSPYEGEGVADPDMEELKEGLNVALGTGLDTGSWLPINRQPSIRRLSGEDIPLTPQIVVEDMTQETFEPDERETAGLTLNASQIAGTEPVPRAALLSPQRPQKPRINTTGLLGSDLEAVESRRSAVLESPGGSRTSAISDAEISPTGNSMIRHLRKASQRVVNIAYAGEEAEPQTEFPFPGASPRIKPAASPTGPTEFPFPPLGPSGTPMSPMEKLSTEFDAAATGHAPFIDTVQFRGKSLGIFGPESAIRNRLCNLLLHPATEPTILLLIIAQTVFLTAQSAPNVEEFPQTLQWGKSWVDYCLLAIFVLYTLECITRIIVSGLIFNPPSLEEAYRHQIGPRPSAIVLQHTQRAKSRSRSRSPARLTRNDTLRRQYSALRVQRQPSTSSQSHISPAEPSNADLRRQYSTVRTTSPGPIQRGRLGGHHHHQHAAPHKPTEEELAIDQPSYPTPFLSAATFHRADLKESEKIRNIHKARLARRAYLRHSFNRVDFIAVVSYWIALILEVTGVMISHHVYVFRMLSCLRIFRLLGITEGTSTILRSLKKAAPLLVQVAFFVGFFWILFAIIGIQTFRGSYRRQCVWEGIQPNYTQEFQFCGGHLDPVTFTPQPYITAAGVPSTEAPKGFLCPVLSRCIEGENPYNNTVSFDNIAQSAELVFVIISANTFTDLMHYAIDAEYMVACLYFIIGIVVLTFWLVNLVIAVITSSLQITREENQKSAFSSETQQRIVDATQQDSIDRRPPSRAKQLYNSTNIFWIAVITTDLIIQALRTSTMSPGRGRLISVTESITTIVLAVEIIVRFGVSFPDWRRFFRSKSNCFDLFLVVATCIIQIPVIHNSSVYGWLTIFQIMRVYRVIMAIPVARDLLKKVLSNVFGIINLMVFLFMITFFVGVLACQLIRGDIPTVDLNGNQYEMSFRTVWNSFLAMYQLLSSENWTQVLYVATTFQTQYHVAWVSAAFLILWFIIGNNVVLSMFIAVIQENIGVTEEEKRKEQVRAFIEKAVPTLTKAQTQGSLTMAAVFRRKKKEPLLDSGPEAFNLIMKEAVVREFLDENDNRPPPPTFQEQRQRQLEEQKTILGRVKKLFGSSKVGRRIGQTFNFYSTQSFRASLADVSRNPNALARDAINAHAQQRANEADCLSSNPLANRSLFLFSADNPIRHLCQLLVAPSRGERLVGTDPNPIAWWIFSGFIYLAIICIVVLACITTPLYQIQYLAEHGDNKFNWITWSDIAFAVVFTIEALIKIIADGFLFTTNAYIRNTWNDIDFLVLITLWINVIADLTDRGGVSRAFRAFKALRALRLVNISDTAQQTFHDVIISGFWNIISAVVVSLSLLIPYAIWGLNIFSGLMYSCNDSNDVTFKSQCVNEFLSSPAAWNVWAPRSWTNPDGYNFDTFGSSLSILFEIVSEEGWIDVLTTAMAITGPDQNPQIDASPLNAIFFVAFNILGSVFILTLFISVIITNYTKRSGVAYMTADQRSWQELRKVLLQLRPSRRPAERPDQSWRAWCYDRAVSKHGYWTRFMTGVYTIHVLLLMAEIYPSPNAYSIAQDYAFLALSIIYIANIIIRMTGLGTHHYFRSLWDVYDLLVVTGTFGTTLALAANVQNNLFLQFQKLFLVGIAFNLIPKNDALDQLFKTAASSLPTILSLLSIWLVLFVVYAIAFTQIFGLTRIGPNGSGIVNFRTIPNALVLLFQMSCGEGWNSIMHDYTISDPHCVDDPNFFKNDCGSPAWAYALFVSWNILSMYIFANMLLTVVYENFSYVYQRAGKLRLFTREEIRRFKKTWAKFDKHATGHIRKDQLGRFFSQLRGIFEVRIHDEYHSVPTILQQCKFETDPTKVHHDASEDISNIDLYALKNCMDRLPVDEIRERRRNFNILYEEAMMSADHRGVSFTSVLLMLAHYKFIDDNKALSLDEFLRRRAKLVRVMDHVNEKICRGFFETLYWRRRFLAQRTSSRPAYTGIVPSIVVHEDELSGLSVPRPALPSLDLTQMRREGGTGYSPTSPVFPGQLSIQLSPVQDDDIVERSSTELRSWSSIVGPDSHLTPSDGQLSQPLDEDEASQVARSLGESVWSDAIRGGSSHSRTPSR